MATEANEPAAHIILRKYLINKCIAIIWICFDSQWGFSGALKIHHWPRLRRVTNNVFAQGFVVVSIYPNVWSKTVLLDQIIENSLIYIEEQFLDLNSQKDLLQRIAYHRCVPSPYQDNCNSWNISPTMTEFFSPIVFLRHVKTSV